MKVRDNKMGYFKKDSMSSSPEMDADVPTLQPDQATNLDNEQSALEYKIHWLEKKIELYKKHGGQDSKYKLLKEELKRLYHDAHGLLNQAKEITEESSEISHQAKESLAVTEHLNQSTRHLKEDLEQTLADAKNELEENQKRSTQLDSLLNTVEKASKDIDTVHERAEKSIIRAYDAEDSFKSAATKVETALSQQTVMLDDCDNALVQLNELITDTSKNKINIDELCESNSKLSDQIANQVIRSDQLSQETINNNVENKKLISKAEESISNAEELQQSVKTTLNNQDDIQQQVTETVAAANALHQTTDLLNEKLLNTIEESKSISSKAQKISNETVEFNTQLKETQEEIQTLILEGELQLEQLQTCQNEYQNIHENCQRITRTAELASAKVTDALAFSASEKEQIQELKDQAHEISKQASDKLHNLTDQLNSASSVVDRLKEFETKSETLYSALTEAKEQSQSLRDELTQTRNDSADSLNSIQQQSETTAQLNIDTEKGLRALERQIADAELLNNETKQLVSITNTTQQTLTSFKNDAEKSLELTNVLNGQSGDLIAQLKEILDENKLHYSKNSTLGEKLETSIKVADEKLIDLNDSLAFTEQLNRQLQDRLGDTTEKQEKIDSAVLEAGAINSESVKINGKSIELAKTTADLNQQCFEQLDSLEKKLSGLDSTSSKIQQLYDENSAFNTQLQHLTNHTHSALDRSQKLNLDTQEIHDSLKGSKETTEKLVSDLSDKQRISAELISNTISITGDCETLNTESSKLHRTLKDAIDLSDTLNGQASRAIADINSSHEKSNKLNNQASTLVDKVESLSDNLESQLDRSLNTIAETDALNEKTQLITQAYQLTQQESQRLNDETQALTSSGQQLLHETQGLNQQTTKLIELTNGRLTEANELAIDTRSINDDANELITKAQTTIDDSTSINDRYRTKLDQYQELHEKYQGALKVYKRQVEGYQSKLDESERIAEQSNSTIKEFHNTVKEFQQINTRSLEAIESSKVKIEQLEKDNSQLKTNISNPDQRVNGLEKSNSDLQHQNESLIKQLEMQDKILQNNNKKPWFRRGNNSTLTGLIVTIGLSLTLSIGWFGQSPDDKLLQEISNLPPTSSGIIDTEKLSGTQTDASISTLLNTVSVDHKPLGTDNHKTATAEATTKKAVTETSEPSSKTTKKSVNQEITQHFSWPIKANTNDPSSVQYEKNRYGISISAKLGAHVLASSEGEVIYSDDVLRGYGHVIMIKHSDDLITIYARNNINHVAVGDKVEKGQHIANVGTLFNDDNSGLYFEVRHNGKAEDPFAYLNNLKDVHKTVAINTNRVLPSL